MVGRLGAVVKFKHNPSYVLGPGRSGKNRYHRRDPARPRLRRHLRKKVRAQLQAGSLAFRGTLEVDLSGLTVQVAYSLERQLGGISGNVLIPISQLNDVSHYLELGVKAITSRKEFARMVLRLVELNNVLEVGIGAALKGWIVPNLAGKLGLSLLLLAS